MLPEPKSCCGCCNVRSGSLVIGSLTIVGCILNIISWVGGINAAQLSEVLNELYKDCDDCSGMINSIVIGTTVVALILNALMLILGSLLIHGIRKEKPQLMTPYLVALVIQFILSVAALIALIIVFWQLLPAVAVIVVIFVIVLALEVYFYLVIRAYQLELLREQGAKPARLEVIA